jgi:hypothetical protein
MFVPVEKGMRETAHAEWSYNRVKRAQNKEYKEANRLDAKADKRDRKHDQIWDRYELRQKKRDDRAERVVSAIRARESRLSEERWWKADDKAREMHGGAQRAQANKIRSGAQGYTYALNSIGRKYGVGDLYRGMGDNTYQYKWRGDKKQVNALQNVIRHRESQKDVSKSLSPEKLAQAKARARAAGRPYPNAFDNMVAGGADWKKGVHKSDDLVFPSWYQVGIPESRVAADPISPLAMAASSRIMLDNSAALLGRNLSRTQKKRAEKNVYQIAGARGLLYSPLGMLG